MKQNNQEIEQYRVLRGPMGSDHTYGNNGLFVMVCPITRRRFAVQVSDGEGWEHVSVSIRKRPNDTPKWEEMCFAKELFWTDNEWVVQYISGKDDYINFHPGTLHLWRPVDQDFPKPPKEMV